MKPHVPTDGRYKHGCRCDGCTEAHRDYTRRQRAKALAEARTSHGTRAAYDCGCRCDRCKNARQVAYYVNGEYTPKSGRRRSA